MSEKTTLALIRLLRNPISIGGIAVASLATLLGLILMFIDVTTRPTNPYTGILTYLILPLAATMGVGIIVIGMIWEERRRRLRPDAPLLHLPRLDLNNKKHRMAVAGTFGALIALIFLMTLTGYRGYQFSNSVQFCGLTCHSVMKPEYTAYQNSPHARVACVDCHIGPGVGWSVKSKITGIYQIYSVMFNKYSRPIKTPIHNLRPAQETCEQCHWPSKFFGAQQKTFTHYLSNTENSLPWQIQMLIKIGGGNPELGEASGIHWHMNIKNEVEYIATDERRNEIPWVRTTDPQGHVTEYMSTGNPLGPTDIPKHPMHRMDCVDCHNRPSHIFNPPARAVDSAITSGLMDRSLPYIKRESVRLLGGTYANEKEALQSISTDLPAFYQQQYPKIYKEKAASILQATQTLQILFKRNIFPEMKTDWRANLNHLSHLTSEGCFRCHDGAHKSSEGKIISNECTTCHTILAQGPPDQVAKTPLHAQPFQHPVDMGVDVTTMKCTTCHSGAMGL
jgi:nitrate/TMAO reductase-like tetraheme cytochrome c subunit